MEVLQAETSRGCFRLPIPGIHNVKNALAAVAVACWLGLDMQQVANAMATFRTTERRFELKGIVAGVTVIDDYAHHPTEIQATLAAAREQFPDRTIWAVFQPHTFSRTRALMDDFVTSFDKADHVIVLDIYPAREVAADFADITAAGLTARLMHPKKRHISTHGEAVTCLLEELQPGDVLLTLGAGDGYLIGERVLAQWKAKAQAQTQERR
jgi:UDP-N-acetylmuramate--alanine ligase